MTLFLGVLAAAISFTAYTTLGSLGLSMQFASTNILNLAFGHLMVIAGYLTYSFVDRGANVWVAALGGVLAIGVASYALGRWLLIPAVRRNMTQASIVLLTLGLSIVMEAFIDMIWSPIPQTIGLSQHALFRAGGFNWTAIDVTAVGVALVLLIAAFVLLTHTTLGRSMRAIATNKELAQTCGIAVDRVMTVSWLVSGLLCGVAGVLLCAKAVGFTSVTGFNFTIVALAAVFVGGVGNMGGAVIGALIVGMGSQFAAAYTNPAFVNVFAFGFLATALLFRPTGIIADVAAHREMVR